jgi:hypothetical protein
MGIALTGSTIWALVVSAERGQLLAHLRQTEDLLRFEREAAERADVRHAQSLRSLQQRSSEERQTLAERHDAAIRAIAAEALRAQVELLRKGYRIAQPGGATGKR